MQSAPGIPFKGKIKSSLFLFALFILISSCGGGSGGSTTGGGSGGSTTTAAATTTAATATATDASVFGTADKISVATAKPNLKARAVKTAASPVAGATVTAIKSDGTSAGTTTTALDGTYTLLLPKNGTYVIKITSGNIVMKSVYTVGTADATVNVNPGTTAAVVILEKKLNTTFDSGTAFSTAIASVDVNASVTAIAATTEFTTTANAVVTAVAAGANPLTDTTVVAAATTAATTVSVASLVGKWMGSSYTAGGVTTTGGVGTLVFTSNTMTITGTNCPEIRSYTTSGNTISTTVTIGGATGCQPVGQTLAYTYSISGNTLSLNWTTPSGAESATLTKLSSTSTIVRYITDAPWVAYQVGTGPWTVATSASTGLPKSYTFDVGSPTAKFGVATACDAQFSKIWQLTRGEAWDGTRMCNNAQILVSVTFTGLTGGNQAAAFIGGKWGTSTGGITNGSTVTGGVHLPGIYDLVAIEYDPATGVASKILIQRDVVIAANTSGITADFANGVAMVSRTVTVTGATASNNAWGNVQIQTKNGTWVDYPFNPDGTALPLPLPPASAMVAGEVFGLDASYDVSAGSSVNVHKALDATVDPVTVTLDPSTVTPFSLSGITVSAGIHPTVSGLSYTKSATSPTLTGFWLSFNNGLGFSSTITATPGWLGTATTYTVPDFTGIGTWNSAWNYSTGTTSFTADVEGESNGWLDWATGGNASPGANGFAAYSTTNVTLKPTLYGPRISMRRD